MYAGKIVELSSAEEVFLRPYHPYTHALLRVVPSILADVNSLKPIPGMPPDLIDLSPGCRFAPRCPRADELCRREEPLLKPVDSAHLVACHRPIGADLV